MRVFFFHFIFISYLCYREKGIGNYFVKLAKILYRMDLSGEISFSIDSLSRGERLFFLLIDRTLFVCKNGDQSWTMIFRDSQGMFFRTGNGWFIAGAKRVKENPWRFSISI